VRLIVFLAQCCCCILPVGWRVQQNRPEFYQVMHQLGKRMHLDSFAEEIDSLLQAR
jgi:hypothetical protein